MKSDLRFETGSFFSSSAASKVFSFCTRQESSSVMTVLSFNSLGFFFLPAAALESSSLSRTCQ